MHEILSQQTSKSFIIHKHLPAQIKMSPQYIFLAHLSWKLKWAFLIAFRPAAVRLSVRLSVRL